MFGHHIRNHPILKKCHIDLIRQISSHMRTRIFFSGDYITYEGDIDECMYFINEGEVLVLSEDTLYSEIIENTLRSGDMWGLEQGIYLRCGHNYTYKANSYCVIVVLNRSWWIHLLEFYPASKHLIFEREILRNFVGSSVHKGKYGSAQIVEDHFHSLKKVIDTYLQYCLIKSFCFRLRPNFIDRIAVFIRHVMLFFYHL